MQTQIIDGTSPRANDQQVVAAVKAKARGNGGGATMVIGVRNETGAIYRRFHVTGLGDFKTQLFAGVLVTLLLLFARRLQAAVFVASCMLFTALATWFVLSSNLILIEH